MTPPRVPFDAGAWTAAEIIELLAVRLRELGVPDGECQIVLTIDATGAVRRAVADHRSWASRFTFGRQKLLVQRAVDAQLPNG